MRHFPPRLSAKIRSKKIPCSIGISPNQNWVVLTISGTITAAAAFQYNHTAHLFGAKHGISRYFVDLRGCRNVDSVTNNLHFAFAEMPTVETAKHARVVLLVDPSDHSHDFIEAAARSAGLDVTLFADQSSAEQHLNVALEPENLEQK